MTDSGGLRDSLASMGFLELALAFVALGCYCLVLNGTLVARTRWVSAGFASVAAGLLVVLTDPWMNGMILVTGGVGFIGVFVAFAWTVSIACGFAVLPARAPLPAVEPDLTTDSAPLQPALRRPSTPAHSA